MYRQKILDHLNTVVEKGYGLEAKFKTILEFPGVTTLLETCIHRGHVLTDDESNLRRNSKLGLFINSFWNYTQACIWTDHHIHIPKKFSQYAGAVLMVEYANFLRINAENDWNKFLGKGLNKAAYISDLYLHLCLSPSEITIFESAYLTKRPEQVEEFNKACDSEELCKAYIAKFPTDDLIDKEMKVRAFLATIWYDVVAGKFRLDDFRFGKMKVLLDATKDLVIPEMNVKPTSRGDFKDPVGEDLFWNEADFSLLLPSLTNYTPDQATTKPRTVSIIHECHQICSTLSI